LALVVVVIIIINTIYGCVVCGDGATSSRESEFGFDVAAGICGLAEERDTSQVRHELLLSFRNYHTAKQNIDSHY